ncbi:MAG: type II toxin-antitoxin system HigB family toxin [Pyrinomonadaceae bacterium]|nr:type II toxin-antitoxin system HigB family toxin [Sphingobacteriaceae bacterium]
MLNIINRRTLLIYCEKYAEASDALKEWYSELARADFSNFNELKMNFGNASIVADNRVVFNIMGNKYRLVVRIIFSFKTVQIKWFGMHSEYDRIDVSTIQYKRK